MRKHRDMLRGFALGVLFTALVAAVPMAADASSGYKRTIDVVYNNIKVVIDGNEVTPRDANGNVVEPFAYNGTTYLPLRAISNALTGGAKPVSWDQSTYTVYIGERPIEPGKVVDMVDMKTYPAGQQAFKAGQSFQLRQRTYTPFNVLSSPSGGVFLLNGDYKTLSGFVACPDNAVYSEMLTYLTIWNRDTNEILFKIQPKPAEEPLPVSVDVTGVDKIEIVTTTSGCTFYNATLTTLSRG